MATTPYSSTRRMGARGAVLIILTCLLLAAAAAFDVRCMALRPAGNTIVLACSAGRGVRP